MKGKNGTLVRCYQIAQEPNGMQYVMTRFLYEKELADADVYETYQQAEEKIYKPMRHKFS